MMPMSLDINYVQSQFPSLCSGYIFADNAGGAQVLDDVITRISDYLTNMKCLSVVITT
jgi:selenocysteine lyase/cysteine desulfurase